MSEAPPRPRGSAGGQDATSVRRNSEFFSDEHYGRHVAELDTYALIREAITREVAGTELLLDVGNGGVFEYDTAGVGRILAIDLFLADLPAERFPDNVEARSGDALALELPDGSHDALLEAFLYHHLVGERAADMEANTRRALAEAARVLRPGGRLVIAESCVPHWFHAVERALYRPLALLARTPLLGGHPATFQLPLSRLRELVAEHFEIESAYEIPHGRWVTQFGRKWPMALTPVRPRMITARKR